MHMDALAGGLGVLVTTDDQAHGTLKTTNASLIYSYHAVINREFSLKFGLQGTFMQKKLDVASLNFGDMIDSRRGFVWNPREAIPSPNKTMPTSRWACSVSAKNTSLALQHTILPSPTKGF